MISRSFVASIIVCTVAGAFLYVFVSREYIAVHSDTQPSNNLPSASNVHLKEWSNSTPNVAYDVAINKPVSPRRNNAHSNSYQTSRDNFALAKTLLMSAKSGDASAQYYLAKVLAECESLLRGPMYKSQDSLETYLNRANNQMMSGDQRDYERQLFSRCKGFLSVNDIASTFGESQQWYKKAVLQRQPEALIESRLNEMASMHLAVADKRASESELEALSDASLADVLDAVRRGDSATFMLISDSLVEVKGFSAKVVNAAFVELACEEGFPCSIGESIQFEAICLYSDCSHSRDLSEYTRKNLTEGDLLQVDVLRRRIKEAIRSDRVETLGIAIGNPLSDEGETFGY